MIAAPTLKSMWSGSFTSLHDGTTAYSAYDPGVIAYATRSPTRTSVTPSPTVLIVPAPSSPGVRGSGAAFDNPDQKKMSKKFSPAAAILTTASPLPAIGAGTSSYFNTSGPP